MRKSRVFLTAAVTTLLFSNAVFAEGMQDGAYFGAAIGDSVKQQDINWDVLRYIYYSEDQLKQVLQYEEESYYEDYRSVYFANDLSDHFRLEWSSAHVNSNKSSIPYCINMVFQNNVLSHRSMTINASELMPGMGASTTIQHLMSLLNAEGKIVDIGECDYYVGIETADYFFVIKIDSGAWEEGWVREYYDIQSISDEGMQVLKNVVLYPDSVIEVYSENYLTNFVE